MEDIPKSLKRLDPNKKQDITFEKRDTLMVFNTDNYWWCYYDYKTNSLYDQFCRKINVNAKDYLMKIGVLNSNNEKIKQSDFY